MIRKNQIERAAYLRNCSFPDFYAHIAGKNFEQRVSDYCLRYGISRKKFQRRSQEEMLKRNWNDTFYPSRPHLTKNEELKHKLDYLEEKLNFQTGQKSDRKKQCPF